MAARSVAIVTDSTADLPPALASSRSITVVPLTLNFDGRSLLDGVDITPSEFYRKLPSAATHPTTSQPSPGRFAETYNELLANHDAIVRKVEAIRPYVQTYFSVATLEFLRRGGRIGRASAMLGSVLQVKPVLCIRDGVVEPLERVRTFERALNRIIELAKAVDRGKGVCAVVGHADAEKDAQKVGKALEPIAETLMIQPLGPVVGAHGGPGVVGVGCYPADLLPLGIKTSRTGAPAT